MLYELRRNGWMDGWMEIKLLGEKKQGKFKKSTLKVK